MVNEIIDTNSLSLCQIIFAKTKPTHGFLAFKRASLRLQKTLFKHTTNALLRSCQAPFL